MNELELIVQQMMADNESDEMIQSVVAEYNKTNPIETGKTSATVGETAPVVAETPENTDLQQENGSLELQEVDVDKLREEEEARSKAAIEATRSAMAVANPMANLLPDALVPVIADWTAFTAETAAGVADAAEFAYDVASPYAKRLSLNPNATLIALAQDGGDISEEVEANIREQNLDMSSVYKAADALRELRPKQYDEEGNVLDAIGVAEQGDYAKAAGMMAEEALGSLPSTVISYAMPGLGSAIIGAGTFGKELEKNLEERSDEDTSDIVSNAAIKGGSEALFEFAGGKLFRAGNKLVKRGAEKAVKELTRNYALNIARKATGGFISEGLTEAGTSAAQLYADAAIFDDEISVKQYLRAAGHSFIVGGLMGGPISGGAAAMQFSGDSKKKALAVVAPQSWRKNQLDMSTRIEETKMDLQQAPDSGKKYFEGKLQSLETQQQKNADALSERWDGLTRKEQIEYAKNVDKVNGGLTRVNNNKYSKTAQEEAQVEMDDAYSSMERTLTPKNIDVETDQAISKTLKFAEKIDSETKGAVLGIQKDDLSIKSVDDATAKEQYGMKNDDARFIFKNGKAEIIINKDVSSFTGATNAVNHELLHYAISKNFKTSAGEMAPLVNDFRDYLKNSYPDVSKQVEDRIAKNYRNPETGEIDESHIEEYLTVFSDLLATQKVSVDESLATKVKNKVTNLARGYGFAEAKLETGKDVFDFIRSYNENVVEKKNFKALDVKLTSSKVAPAEFNVDKEALSKSMDNVAFEEGSVNQEFQKFTYDGKKNTAPESFQAEAAMAYEPLAQAVVDRISKVGLGVSKEQDQFIMDYLADSQNKEDIVSDLTFGTERNKASSLLGLAKSYNPEVGSFGGYAKSQLANRAIRVLEERVGKQVTQSAQTIDSPESKEVASDDIDVTSTDSRSTIEKLNVPNATDKVNKLTELSIVKADKALSGKDFTTTKKIAARDKAFYEIFSKQLFNDIKTIVGKNTKNSKDFTKFIDNNFDLLSQIALDNIDFQKGGGPSSTWNKMPPTKEEFIAYYEAAGEKTSTKSDRKKSLNNAIARQIANEARIKYAEDNTDEADRFAEESGIVLASKTVSFNNKELDASVALVEWYKTIDLNPNLVFKGNTGERLEKVKDIKNKWKSRFGFSIYPGAVAELLTQKDKMLIGFNPKTDKDGNISIKASDATGGLDLEGLNNLGDERNIEVKQGMNDIHGSGSFKFNATNKVFEQGSIPNDLWKILEPKLKEKTEAYEKYAKELNLTSLPATVTDSDYQRTANARKDLSFDIDLGGFEIVENHYNTKSKTGINTIAYYTENQEYALNQNAVDAGYPRRKSKVFAQIRVKASGSKDNASGVKTRGFTISVDFRTAEKTTNGIPIEKALASKTITEDFNKMLERVKGVKAEAKYSEDRANKLAGSKGKFKFFVPYSAEDFVGLIYPTLGKGKEGDRNMQWYKETLLDPFAIGISNFEKAKQAAMNDWAELKKRIKNTPAGLKKEAVRGFTNEEAVRVYLWNENGVVPETLAKKDVTFMVKHVKDNKVLKDFAEGVKSVLSGRYPDPQGDWLAGTLTTDLINDVNTVGRKEFLQQWQENVDAVYSKDNMNKLKAIYGERYTEALENILHRMKTGRNRPGNKTRLENSWMDWVNDSVGTVMFFNTRSALLQTISSINFLNWSDNNPLMAGKAFANQPQYWKDFALLFNSDFLKQRRSGLKNDVNADEIANAAATSTNKVKAAMSALLQAGFLPTQMADSFAISIGGASFYRNRLNTYIKDGLSEQDASEKAMLDFQESAEESQQSSRPDRVSMQQAGSLGRIILAFANTPMQYTRLTKKAALDLANGRGDWKTNMSKILYYGAVQNIVFTALQQAMFAMAFDDDTEDEEKEASAKIVNGIADTFLRGSGVGGAAVATMKNIILEVIKQKESKRPDYTKAALKATTLSPPIDTKIRKLMSAGRSFTYKQSLKDMKSMGIDVDNPAGLAVGQMLSAAANIPLDRAILKARNVKGALDTENEAWQQIALALGYSEWQLGIEKDKSKSTNAWLEGLRKTDPSLYNSIKNAEKIAKGVGSPAKKLAKGEAGQAHRDGTIEIDPDLSPIEREKTIVHEKQHVQDMKAGRLDYDDNYVYWNGKKYERKNGKIKYNGKWYTEGHKDLPWEKKAYNAEPTTQEIKKRKKLY